MRRFILVFLLFLATLCTAADKSQSSALLKQAAERSNIRSSDTAPFQLRAKIRILDSQPIEAGYLLIWNTQQRWREEISIGDKRSIRIGGEGTVSAEGDSEQAQTVRSAVRDLDLATNLNMEPGASLSGIKVEQKNGVALQCVSRTGKYRPKTELCFDSAQGVLSRENFSSTGLDLPAKSTEFSDYFDFGGKLFPRVVRTFENRTLRREVQVEQLTYDPNPDQSMFDSSTQYKVVPGCEFPAVPRPIKLSDPEYPERLRTKSPQRVKVSAVVNETGGVQDIQVTNSAGDLDQYAIKALEKWKFAPATCGAKPVPFQFFSEVNFRTY